MKTLTVRVPDAVVAEIETAARARKVTKSDVIRERLSSPSTTADQRPPSLQAIAHLIGSVKGLPADLERQQEEIFESRLWPQTPSLTVVFSSHC